MKKVIGRKPLLEAINKGLNLEKIVIAYNQKGKVIDKIIVAAKKRGIKISRASTAKFKELEQGSNSQGVIGILSNLNFYLLDEIISILRERKNPLTLLIDSVQDPHNLGAILRTADAAGVDAVFVTVRNTAPFSDVVTKASAGAINFLKICKVKNLSNLIEILKQNKFWIVGSSLDAEISYLNVDYNMPVALVVGNEGQGIRPSILKKCDFVVKIPMLGKVQSLNVSVSTGILLYQILQRRNKLLNEKIT